MIALLIFQTCVRKPAKARITNSSAHGCYRLENAIRCCVVIACMCIFTPHNLMERTYKLPDGELWHENEMPPPGMEPNQATGGCVVSRCCHELHRVHRLMPIIQEAFDLGAEARDAIAASVCVFLSDGWRMHFGIALAASNFSLRSLFEPAFIGFRQFRLTLFVMASWNFN